VQSTVLWSGTRPFTAFAKETLKASRPARFISVLMPHGEEVSAAHLAGRIGAHGGAEEPADIALPGPAGTIRVQLGGDGAWSVRREDQAAR